MKTHIVIFFALVALAACQPAADVAEESAPETEATPEEYLDPIEAAPDLYALEFENDYLRVLREQLDEGTEVPMHSHRDRVSVYLEDAEAELTVRGGEAERSSTEAGTASWGDATTHGGVTHSSIHNLSIELKELSDEAIEVPELDATKVDAEHHVVELENDRVRVVRMTYPAGETSPVHEHLPGFNVVLEGGQTRNIPEGGEPAEATEAVAGTASWTDGGPPHATENLGEEDVVVIRVEMKKKPASTT